MPYKAKIEVPYPAMDSMSRNSPPPPPLPALPSGRFVAIGGQREELFQFKVLMSCKDFAKDSSLTLPIHIQSKEQMQIQSLYDLPNPIRIGSKFLYDHDVAYEVDTVAGIKIPPIKDAASYKKRTHETSKNEEMASRIREYLKEDFVVETVMGQGESESFCRFSGGG